MRTCNCTPKGYKYWNQFAPGQKKDTAAGKYAAVLYRLIVLCNVQSLFRTVPSSQLILALYRNRPFPLAQVRKTTSTNLILSGKTTAYLLVALVAYLRPCDYRYVIGFPGRALIGPSCSVYFIRFRSRRFLSNPDRTS